MSTTVPSSRVGPEIMENQPVTAADSAHRTPTDRLERSRLTADRAVVLDMIADQRAPDFANAVRVAMTPGQDARAPVALGLKPVPD